MKTYKIPNTDLEVSRLAYGTMHMGGSWDKTPPTAESKKHAVELIHTAVDHGINHIDLADIYAMGKSDMVVGHVFTQQPGLRQKLVLQEKCGIMMAADDDFGPPGRFDFSYDHIVASVEKSLQRLGTTYVDILTLHRPDLLIEYEDVAKAFDHLQSSGKVRYFGVSNHTAHQIAALQKYIDQKLVVNQIELNLQHHYMISDGILANIAGHGYANVSGTLDYCRANDIMIQAWSPVAGGQLFNTSDDAPSNVRQTAYLIAELAQKHNVSATAIALAWLLRHPAGIQPVLGTLNLHRLEASIPAVDVELSRKEWYALLESSRGESVP